MYPVIAFGFLAVVVGLVFTLRRTQAELRSVAGHTPSAMAHVVGHGEKLSYLFVNQRYAALYGRQPSGVIGKHPKDVLGSEVFSRSHGNMCRAIAGETVTFDLQLEDKMVEVVYHPDVPPPSKARGFVGVITDVSELRRLQNLMLRDH